MTADLDKRLDYVAHMAIEYAGLEKEGLRESRPRRLALVNAAAGFSALEMAYFCLQAMSHYSKDAFDNATMLTIFTNRLKQELEEGQ